MNDNANIHVAVSIGLQLGLPLVRFSLEEGVDFGLFRGHIFLGLTVRSHADKPRNLTAAETFAGGNLRGFLVREGFLREGFIREGF